MVFHTLRWQVKREVKRQLKRSYPADQLLLIKVADGKSNGIALEWIEKHEFRLGGEMYDVVSSTHQGDTTYYQCLNDAKEKQLFADLDAHIYKHIDADSPQSKELKKIIKSFIKDMIPDRADTFVFHAPAIPEQKYPSFIPPAYATPEVIDSPPPEMYFASI